MKSVLSWVAAAASLIGLFLTLRPVAGALTPLQIGFIVVIVIVFGVAAISDLREEHKRATKRFKNSSKINNYMYSMLRKSGNCEICSRDASWISDNRINALLKEKSSRNELTFLVHHSTPELNSLAELGAEVIEYGVFGFDPMTRFTVVNAGNISSSYVAIGHRKRNERHIIEELDSSHPTYQMARDLILSIKAANDQFKKD